MGRRVAVTCGLGWPGGALDGAACGALGLALVAALAPLLRRSRVAALLTAVPMPVWVAVLAACAALLSHAYRLHYLRGGPRIIDATSYWLEARTMATGHFTFAPPGPLASFAGRFLETPDGSSRLGVIFPPGYPAVLALGFLLGLPWAIGPTLAAALVVATFALARRTAGRDDVALLAAVLSTLSAALRYHTADTMSHGLAALLGTLTLLGALAASPRATLGAGLAAGWLIATRPVSGVVFLALAAAVLLRRPRRLLNLALGCLPGLALLVAHQVAVTGLWWTSSQARYYALADGPPGCFVYGFGSAIGCRFEHGDFVESMLPDGFGPWAALRVTGGRLFVHLRDAANLPLLAPLVVVGAASARRRRQLGWLALGVLGIVVAHVPFYFDGSYPGGGARFYADALPLEHVLLAQGFFVVRALGAAIPLVAGGFAAVTSADHRALADREQGRPYFEPAALAAAGVERGLVFVDTDHGFSLGFDPGVASASTGVVVARWRGDAHDALLWDRLGRPPAYHYLRGGPAGPARLAPIDGGPEASHRFEAESLWPPLEVRGGWAHPDFPACASGRRALRLRGSPAPVHLSLRLEPPTPGRYRITARWANLDGRLLPVRVTVAGRTAAGLADRRVGACWSLPLGVVTLPAGPASIEIQSPGDGVAFDALDLDPDH